MIYLCVGVLIAGCAYVEAISRSRAFSRAALPVVLMALVGLAGLRNNVGADWVAYFEMYKDGDASRVETGYALINGIFSHASVPYVFFLLFINSIGLLLMFLFLRETTKLAMVGCLLFFSDLYLYYNLSGIRQAIALAITCYGLRFAQRRQFWLFSLVVALAMSFHLSAAVFIIAYFIPRQGLRLRHAIYLSIASALGYYYLHVIADAITAVTLKDASFYVDKQVRLDSALASYYIGLLRRCMLLGVMLFTRRRLFEDPANRYLANIYLCGVALYAMTYMISPDIGVRMSSYFTIVDIVIAGNIIYVMPLRSSRLAIVSVFVIFALYKIAGYMNAEFYSYSFVASVPWNEVATSFRWI